MSFVISAGKNEAYSDFNNKKVTIYETFKLHTNNKKT
jgi:hypothetical protein